MRQGRGQIYRAPAFRAETCDAKRRSGVVGVVQGLDAMRVTREKQLLAIRIQGRTEHAAQAMNMASPSAPVKMQQHFGVRS